MKEQGITNAPTPMVFDLIEREQPRIDGEVADAFAKFPCEAQKTLKVLRRVLLEEANRLNVGPIQETLKWGEPAYLTTKSKAGSTIRLGWKQDAPELVSIFFNCKTNLVEEARAHFPQTFEFVGNRALSLRIGDELPEAAVRTCLAMALTYHRNKLR